MKLSEVKINKGRIESFTSILILNRLINDRLYLKVGDYDTCIDPILTKMFSSDLINLIDNQYVPTNEGRSVLKNFVNKYTEFLKVIDLYCAVDLGTGEFAFSPEMFTMLPDEYEALVNEDRFDDLRLAVCRYKGVDVLEAAFMIMLDKDRFNLLEPEWEFELMSNLIWEEMTNIINESKDYEHITYSVDEIEVDGKDIVESVICEGNKLMSELLEAEKAMLASEDEEECGEEEDDEEEYYEEVVEYVEYVEVVECDEYLYDYDYYDPYYNDALYASALLTTAIILY